MVLTLKENNENLEEILSSLINQTFGDYIAIPIVRGNPIRKISINLFEDNCICINKLVDDRMVESDKKA